MPSEGLAADALNLAGCRVEGCAPWFMPGDAVSVGRRRPGVPYLLPATADSVQRIDMGAAPFCTLALTGTWRSGASLSRFSSAAAGGGRFYLSSVRCRTDGPGADAHPDTRFQCGLCGVFLNFTDRAHGRASPAATVFPCGEEQPDLSATGGIQQRKGGCHALHDSRCTPHIVASRLGNFLHLGRFHPCSSGGRRRRGLDQPHQRTTSVATSRLSLSNQV